MEMLFLLQDITLYYIYGQLALMSHAVAVFAVQQVRLG